MQAGEWTAVRVRSSAKRAEVLKALFALGAEGVQELDGLWITHIRDLDRTRATTVIADADARAALEFGATPDVFWTVAWRDRLAPQRAGLFVVSPPWRAGEVRGEHEVVIDPGMAFGTGDHETTRGVLRLLPAVLRRGDRVADLGAGSGVLGIAAARLGARHVFCIEVDEDALPNAIENVARNGVADRVTVLGGDAAALLPLVAPVELVLANIIAPVLRSVLPAIAVALVPGGRAILSGILVDECEPFERDLIGSDWRVTASDSEGPWWTAAIARA